MCFLASLACCSPACSQVRLLLLVVLLSRVTGSNEIPVLRTSSNQSLPEKPCWWEAVADTRPFVSQSFVG